MPLITSAASAVSIVTPQSTATIDTISVLKIVTPDALMNGFSTLLGVLIGAMLAYLLQRRFQKNLRRMRLIQQAIN
jgi:ABC-type branched-subunit amino acid transport system permease subunit